ncbi:MAG: DUF4838 domain-containing protein [Planctomycetota bacterium]|nr:DUF4838 domain-containing protein [Planctomycetota bacterium]
MSRCLLSVIFIVLLLPASLAWAADPQGVDLAALEGWDIIVPAEAIPSETYAAEQLQHFLGQAAGRTLPIRKKADGGKYHIFVGRSKAMRASDVGFETAGMGKEDLRIVIRDGNIAIAGGRPRGTLYGVYTFLEDHLGVRFLTPEHTHVPAVGEKRVVGPVDYSYSPPLSFRWSYYGETNRNPLFASRMRCNTVPKDAKYGGITGRHLISHTFSRQLPTSRYGEKHPEYFALRDGKRLSKVKNDSRHTEPCASNPQVQRIVTQSVLAEIAANPQRTNVSVSQNDNHLYCQCDKCAAIDARADSHMGAQLELVNAVADAVAKKHPGVDVGTLAYVYSRKPPKNLRPRPNVQIQLCSIECSQIYPIDDRTSRHNQRFCDDLVGWGKICDDICIWTYNTNFHNYLLPCPNLRNIEPNIRLFVAHNTKGIFMQGPGNAVGGDFSGLRNYMTSRLLWNPELSGETLMDEFLRLHYGKASPPIHKFLDRLCDNARAKGVDKNCFAHARKYAIDESIGKAALDAVAEAAALADSDAVRARVDKARIWAHRAAVGDLPKRLSCGMRDQWGRREITLKDFPTMDQADIDSKRPHMREMLALCEKHGVDRWSEGWSINAAMPVFRKFFGLKEGEEF